MGRVEEISDRVKKYLRGVLRGGGGLLYGVTKGNTFPTYPPDVMEKFIDGALGVGVYAPREDEMAGWRRGIVSLRNAADVGVLAVAEDGVARRLGDEAAGVDGLPHGVSRFLDSSLMLDFASRIA